jgi:aconitate hydratase
LRKEIHQVEEKYVIPAMFKDVYSNIQRGNKRWNDLQAPEGMLYPWDAESTYIKNPPFFQGMTKELTDVSPIKSAYVLLNVPDSVTTDHISPAGSISRFCRNKIFFLNIFIEKFDSDLCNLFYLFKDESCSSIFI